MWRMTWGGDLENRLFGKYSALVLDESVGPGSVA